MYYLVTDAGGRWHTLLSYVFLETANAALEVARRDASSNGQHYLVCKEKPEERRAKRSELNTTTS